MNKKVYLLFVFFSWLMITPLFSQIETSWMKRDRRIILDKVMNMEYSHPAGYVGDSLYNCIVNDHVEVNLVSNDMSFRVFYSIHNPITKEDSINRVASIMIPEKFNLLFVSEDLGHIDRAGMITSLSFGNSLDWKSYFKYYSSDDAKTKFNADTVLVSVSLPFEVHPDYTLYSKREINPYYDINGRYNSNYTYCTVLIIQKKGRGFVTLYCYYDDNAAKNLDIYMAAIEGTLRYREGEPELKKHDFDENICVFAFPTQPRLPVTGNE